ncbi:MAG: hypothetical protein JWR21_2598 [Herminiimonas sp.]|nr:hypothetical protein [Herminiimonas sp.]
MIAGHRYGNEGSVTVVASGGFAAKGFHFRVPTAGLAMHAEILHEVCFTEANALSHDLSLLLGAIKCADRSIPRHHGKCWARKVSVTVPVYELQTWRRLDVVEPLVDCLDYLTGDDWRFEFVKRKGRPGMVVQLPLLISPDKNRIFIPFSHGLDSFAQATILASGTGAPDIVPVHMKSGRSEPTMKSIRHATKAAVVPVPVVARGWEPKHAELTFRTRPFLYDSLAAYASVLAGGGGQVLIPENGQGSLGGSLVRLGAEAPHRSCHPGFTNRLAKFMSRLTSRPVAFAHPALMLTKGQVLLRLVAVRPESGDWLKQHFSCSYDARHANHASKRVHCGVCGNCLLRRMSVFACGIRDPT